MPDFSHARASNGRGTLSEIDRLPSVDGFLRTPHGQVLIDGYGRDLVVDATRRVLSDLRTSRSADSSSLVELADLVQRACAARLAPSFQSVFNLTGTILHTNLGRAPLAHAAIDAIVHAASTASNLEYDLDTGRRGDRHRGVADRLTRLTGAEDALVVNNNAAAIHLVLNSLARRKEVPVSRGELVEIGGSFRMPDIMANAGCKLIEVGTTNRTHLDDYRDAIHSRTALLLKVHTSNFSVSGFTSSVSERPLAALASSYAIPLIVDLGSGALVDLSRWNLPRETLVSETLDCGADLVTFSGDKLLGGPQAGLITGRHELIQRLRRNPLARAMRADKLTLAALDATLTLYEDPDRLPDRLPVLGFMTRSPDEILQQANRLRPPVADALPDDVVVAVVEMQSQIGSGAQPAQTLPSYGLAITTRQRRKGSDARLRKISAWLRCQEIPVISSLRDGALMMDLRCLTDEESFVKQLANPL